MKANLKFEKGKDGQPVARLDSGKIVLVDRYASTRPLPGEVWECEVIERDRFAIAKPVQKIEWTDWWFDMWKCCWVRENIVTGEVQTRPVTSPEDFPEEYVREVHDGDREAAWVHYNFSRLQKEHPYLPVLEYGEWVWVDGYEFRKSDDKYKEFPSWQAYQAGTDFEQVYRDVEDVNNVLNKWNTYRMVVVKKPPACPKCGHEVKMERIFEDDPDCTGDSWSKYSPDIPQLAFAVHYRGVCSNCGYEVTQYQNVKISDKTEVREMTIEKNTIRVTFQLTIRKVIRIYEGKKVVQLRTYPKITRIYCKCAIPKYYIKSSTVFVYDNKDIIWEGEVL